MDSKAYNQGYLKGYIDIKAGRTKIYKIMINKDLSFDYNHHRIHYNLGYNEGYRMGKIENN